MTVGEFRRWLAKQGAIFDDSGARHSRVFLNGKKTVLSRHIKQELPTGTVQGIKKQLGLK